MQTYLALSEDDLAACLALRREVFIEEQNVPETLEVDGEDHLCNHVIAKIDGQAVGTARYRTIGSAFKVQRVCVPKKNRGANIGAAVMRFIIETAQTAPEISAVTLSSQKDAIAFYQKLGFAIHGDEYMDAGIPHMDMTLAL